MFDFPTGGWGTLPVGGVQTDREMWTPTRDGFMVQIGDGSGNPEGTCALFPIEGCFDGWCMDDRDVPWKQHYACCALVAPCTCEADPTPRPVPAPICAEIKS